ncbi:hypothetical protein vBAcePPAc_0174 [Aeromonas phage vB_AceP_PAc]|nr:hypothetical protein vBAcePPAc_0174 [Aeromonas phage vB_AceP_PAc]
MLIYLGKDKQLSITEVINFPTRFSDSARYTVTGRNNLKLFQIEIKAYDDRYDEWYDENDYVEFWADSYENSFSFLKETVSNYLSCFDKNEYVDNNPCDLWNICNIEKYLAYYINDDKYIEISREDSQKDIIIKCNEVTERLHYSLRKTSELVHKLDDCGILDYLY